MKSTRVDFIGVEPHITKEERMTYVIVEGQERNPIWTETKPMSYEDMAKLVKELKEGSEEMQKTANDRQVGGTHYKDKAIQPWDVVDAGPHAQAIGFYRWSALAYIMRAGDKGPAREDYEKAIHYLEKLLEIL
jgi:hypothetical protein